MMRSRAGSVVLSPNEEATINTLTVWKFPAPEAVDDVVPRLRDLVVEGRVAVDDAAVVSWPAGRSKPQTEMLGRLTGPGELWGGFWGMLLGLIFLTPLAGPTFGAAAGAIAGSLSDFGVSDDFVKRVRDTVTPGSSALFLLSDGPTRDTLVRELRGVPFELVRTQLSAEQERRLLAALGDESRSAVS
jgi:uncharacterized membrane protein